MKLRGKSSTDAFGHNRRTSEMSLSEAQIEEFRDKGFIVLAGFFDGPVMTRVSAWLDALRDKQPADKPAMDAEAKYYETSPLSGDNILVRIENVFGDLNPDFAGTLISPEARQCLSQLLGEPPILFKEKINYKLPGCRPDKLHQDQAAGWNAYCDYFITMGIVVDANRKDNAALSFMKSGNYERALMTEEWKPLTEDDPPYQPEDEYVLLEADPGDVVFFDAYVPHGSPANTSERSRRNIFHLQPPIRRQYEGRLLPRQMGHLRAQRRRQGTIAGRIPGLSGHPNKTGDSIPILRKNRYTVAGFMSPVLSLVISRLPCAGRLPGIPQYAGF
jgi:ectoine hydroxylase-related dioxygenase (phytanoyl-CoA dioxygenase family)